MFKQIRVSEELYIQIKINADLENKSVSKYFNDFLSNYFRKIKDDRD